MSESTEDKPICFVICPIGPENSPTRQRSDQVLKHIITPVVTALGYADPIRADRISDTGIITSQILQHILDDDLVIADLTERNPNVYYELAVRHATGKPTVQLIHATEDIPFDVSGIRAIKFDYHDLDSVDACKKLLAAQINTFKSGATTETPVSQAINFQALKQTDTPEATILTDIATGISRLQTQIDHLQKSQSVAPSGIIWPTPGQVGYTPTMPIDPSSPILSLPTHLPGHRSTLPEHIPGHHSTTTVGEGGGLTIGRVYTTSDITNAIKRYNKEAQFSETTKTLSITFPDSDGETRTVTVDMLPLYGENAVRTIAGQLGIPFDRIWNFLPN